MRSHTMLILSACLALGPTAFGAVVPQNPGIEAETAAKLLSAKRIYVDSLGEDKVSKSVQAMVINALTESKKFIVTENRDKADMILIGAAVQKSTQELHATSDGTSVATVAGSGRATTASAVAAIAGLGTAIQDASASTETIDHAEVAVRLVSSDGDTIWSTTQESRGAKFKGAAADVADKIVKQLLRDLEKLQKARDAGKQDRIPAANLR